MGLPNIHAIRKSFQSVRALGLEQNKYELLFILLLSLYFSQGIYFGTLVRILYVKEKQIHFFHYKIQCLSKCFNQFHVTGVFAYFLETSEVSYVLWGVERDRQHKCIKPLRSKMNSQYKLFLFLHWEGNLSFTHFSFKSLLIIHVRSYLTVVFELL